MDLVSPESRVDISLDVKVWGLDVYGKPFVQHARTVNTSSVWRMADWYRLRTLESTVISLQHW